MLWQEQVTGGEVREIGCGREGLGSRAVRHGNRRSGAWAGDSSVINGGAETVDGWGRVCGMMVEVSGSRAFGDNSVKGFRP